jgi:hypothetical protein
MNTITADPADDVATLAPTDDATAPVVREAAVAYAVRPSPRPRPAPTAPPAPAAGDGLARLKTAAETGDGYAFLVAWRAIDWRTRSAEDFVRAVRWALAVGAHREARRLAVEGAERYPDHAELCKAARVLDPPYVVRRAPSDPGIQADMAWLDAHWHEYRGRWVAIRNGEFLGAATVLDDLVAQIGDIKGVMLAPVA